MLLDCVSAAFMELVTLYQALQTVGLPLVNPVVSAVKMAEALQQ